MSEQTPEHGFADDAGRYRLDSRIATGGMGEVWRGTDMTLGREVAIKLLKKEYADDTSFRARFQTEAHHAASLHHPNIAAVYDFGESSDDDGSDVKRPFLVMELVDGQPLSALLRPDEPMDPDAVRELLSQAADGLAAAHAAGIVHRDVKPANLLVTPDHQVKITDFGIARAAEGLGLTQTGEVMGTPQYISPEQAQGQTATPASDVYSLGIVAFECLAGRRPYVADTAVATALAHLREPVPALPEFVPDDLATVVRRAMAKLPQDRFDDGAAFAAALRDPATAATQVVDPPANPETQLLPVSVAPDPVPVPGPTPGHSPENADRTRRRNSLYPILAVLALVIVAVLAVFLIAQGLPGGDDPADGPGKTPKRSPASSHTTSQEPSEEPSSATTSEAPPSSSSAPASQSPSDSQPSSQSPSDTSSSAVVETPSQTASTGSATPSQATSSAVSSRTPTTSSSATTSPRPAAATSSSPAPAASRGGVDSR